MLTVKPVYKLSNAPDNLKWAINTHMTTYTHFQGITKKSMVWKTFAPNLFTRLPPVHPHFYPSIFVVTRPNDGWTGLYIKL